MGFNKLIYSNGCPMSYKEGTAGSSCAMGTDQDSTGMGQINYCMKFNASASPGADISASYQLRINPADGSVGVFNNLDFIQGTDPNGTYGVISFALVPVFHAQGVNSVWAGPNAGGIGTLNSSIATDQVGVGTNSMLITEDSTYCTAVGSQTMTGLHTGTMSTAIGYGSVYQTTQVYYSTAVGAESLYSLNGGAASYDTCIGYQAGFNYLSAESNNVILGCVKGTASENGIMRLGNDGSVSGSTATSQTYITGIYGNTPSSAHYVTINSSGQLGSATIPSTGVTSIAGTALEITASASTGAVTLSLPSAVTMPGSLIVTSGFTVSAGTITTPLTTAGIVTTTSGGIISSEAVVPVANGGTGASTFTSNGILYGNTTSALQVTAAGTTGQILTNTSGTPAWTTNTYPATDAAGDLLYCSATNVISGLAIGSTGQVLTVAAGLPSWAAASGGGATYVDETSTTVAMTNGDYYSSNSSSLITYTLPSTAAFGTELAVFGYNTGGWKIAQNASQNIRMGNTVTTTGTGGSLASSARGDCVKMYCAVANTTWVVTSSMGNVTIV